MLEDVSKESTKHVNTAEVTLLLKAIVSKFIEKEIYHNRLEINSNCKENNHSLVKWLPFQMRKLEKLWSFNKERNVLIEKIYILQIYSTTAKLLIFRSDLRKKKVCSKSATEMLCRNKFLVIEFIFKLVCHCESCRLSEIGCA